MEAGVDHPPGLFNVECKLLPADAYPFDDPLAVTVALDDSSDLAYLARVIVTPMGARMTPVPAIVAHINNIRRRSCGPDKRMGRQCIGWNCECGQAEERGDSDTESERFHLLSLFI